MKKQKETEEQMEEKTDEITNEEEVEIETEEMKDTEEVVEETAAEEKNGTRPSDAELKEKRKEKNLAEAVVNVYTSFNNTIVHVTDMSGKTLAKVTGGMVTKHGRLKANPTIAMFIANVSEKLKELGVGNLFFRIRAKTRNPAPGPGANAMIKSLSREGFKILNILDTTRFPRGGPKKKGGRRGRRP
jgi:ribosomal protein S11